MATLKVKIESLDQMMASVAGAMKAVDTGAVAQTEYSLSFPSWDAMHGVLTPQRLAIVKAMTGNGEMTLNDVALGVDRDVKAVQSDVDTLLNAGILDKAENGVIFPYDRIHFEFEIQSAA